MKLLERHPDTAYDDRAGMYLPNHLNESGGCRCNCEDCFDQDDACICADCIDPGCFHR